MSIETTASTRPTTDEEIPSALAESEPAARCGGDTCPTRSTAENDSFDYCANCPQFERWCQGCQQWRPQAGWWWGAVWGQVDKWVCASCRYELEPSDVTIDNLNKAPSLRSHPDFHRLAGAVAFTLTVDLVDEQRFRLAELLDRVGQRCEAVEAASVLEAMTAAVRAGNGSHRIDTSELTLEHRRQVEEVLHRVANRSDGPPGAWQLLGPVQRAWTSWLDAQTVPAVPEPTAEHKAAVERARRRRGYERKAADHG